MPDEVHLPSNLKLASRKELDKNRKDLNRKPHLDTGLSEF
jgi:hypothetical protein